MPQDPLTEFTAHIPGPRRWEIPVPPVELLNSNQRMHHMPKARITKALRETGCTLARARRLPKLHRAHLLYLVHPGPGRGKLDPGNWYPSVKALLDGLVDAG